MFGCNNYVSISVTVISANVTRTLEANMGREFIVVVNLECYDV